MLRVHHIGIVVSDALDTTSKIERAFGIASREGIDATQGQLTVRFVDLPNASLEIIQPVAKEHPQAKWLAQHGSGIHHVALEVAGLGDELKRLTDAGIISKPIPQAPGAGNYVYANVPEDAVGGWVAQLVEVTS